ncbi:sentrin-specific protease 1-like [Olea europaea subsp. europaea]|uniref:Sentrin-specific protease 1-like n=1 Tax=Olea europaea subsp. europaea TaxID=158383 RepID=A0A8S0RRZ2_OLEEU|nr:sentrin-specific protease 1-like [Olea europaea subsp. europaea]
MSVAIDAMKSEILSLKHDQQNKLNNIIHMQGEIHTDLIDIRSNLQFMTESMTALISSSMEEILTKFRDKSGLNIVRDYEPLDKVGDAEITVDSKGKGKMETDVDVEFPYSLQPPSFNLGICFTQPTPIEPTKSKKVEMYVASVVYDVLKDTESAEKVESPVSAQSSGLPVKRAPRPAKALQSPYVHEGKQNKHSNNVVIFQHYNQSVDHADIADFQSWFQRGYKPNNKKKFNDRDDRIRPPFLVGARIPLSKPWAEVDLVFMPILPTNKAHWMLAVLDIKKQTLLVLNSARKTYNDIKILIGIDPFVKMIPHLMDRIGIWRKDSNPSANDSKELKVVLNFSVLQQNNG